MNSLVFGTRAAASVDPLAPDASETARAAASPRVPRPVTAGTPDLPIRGVAAAVETAITLDRMRLVDHPLYAAVDSLDALRTFMQWHVFAVWDFMSLTKRLQRDLTCVDLPWTAPRHPRLARFVNEIVLDEESDVGLDGEPLSHLQMYLHAMEEVGADKRPFLEFLDALAASADRDVDAALRACGAPDALRDFVNGTVRVARHGQLDEAAAWFLFGREDVIPDMFTRLLENGFVGSAEQAPWFVFYLQRHVQLDGEEHGDLARELLDAVATESNAIPSRIAGAASTAIQARIALWDGVLAALPSAD